MSDDQRTHGESCYLWDRHHYECALREIERLRAEVARHKDAIEPRIRSLDAGGCGVRMDLEGGACRLMAEWLADEYKRNSGINYVECRFTSHEAVPGEAFVVTVQRVNGKTPNQLQKDAERELAELRERFEKAPVSCVTETDNQDMKSTYYAIAPQELDGHRVRLVRED